MRRIFQITLVVALMVSLFTADASAHSGRTDANGGHYNRSTGEYHYHHGYTEHQHIDGVCPYDFDDQTDHSSSKNVEKVDKNAEEAIEELTPEPKKEENKSLLSKISNILGKVTLTILFVIMIIIEVVPLTYAIIICPIQWLFEWLVHKFRKKK